MSAKFRLIAVVFLATAAPLTTRAQQIAVPNFSFEDFNAVTPSATGGWGSLPAGHTDVTPATLFVDDEFFTSPSGFFAGWQENSKTNTSAKFGLQHPSDAFYPRDANHQLEAPFLGDFVGFANLTTADNGGTTGGGTTEHISQVQSGIIGNVAQGTYTLQVAFGNRRGNGTWNDYSGTISLVTDPVATGFGSSGGTVLGTAASITMIPSLVAAGAPASSAIKNLVYTVNIGAGNPNIGKQFAIRIDSVNLGTRNGVASPAGIADFTQANFDNVRLNAPLFQPPDEPTLTVNRGSGEITLGKNTVGNIGIAGYQIESLTYGSLNQNNWTKISVAYDESGNHFVDPDNDWRVMSAAGDSSDMSEAEMEGGNGGVIQGNISLGAAWRKTPYQDITGKLLLTNGQQVTVPVTYTGTAIAAGDLDGLNGINVADWQTFKNNYTTNLSAMSIAEAYAFGDMDQNKIHDIRDYAAFRSAYNAANGPGAFEAMLAVPEPASVLTLVVAGMATCGCLGRRSSSRRLVPNGARVRRSLLASLALMAAVAWHVPSASAQSVLAHWSFDSSTITTGSAGITAATDQTGVHNATTVYAGTGGTGAGPQINSVPGQFGTAAEFTNANANNTAQPNRAWMSFPQLTEIAGPSGGSFSVAAWAKIPDQPNWDPVTILGDWGNAAANITGPPAQGRFTYWFFLSNADTNNPNIRPRGQLRSYNNNAAGNGNGTDMISTTLSAAQSGGVTSFDDGVWHHFVWTWDKPNYRMTYFIDGVQVHQQAAIAGNPDHDLYVSASSVGAIGAKNDNNRYFTGSMDELWVYNGLLDGTQVANLKNFNDIGGQVLRLVTDANTGQMRIVNPATNSLTLSLAGYEITSAANGLDRAGWDPIQSQGAKGFPVGEPSGNGWETDISSTNGRLTEWYLTGSSNLAPGQYISLGDAYNDATDATDLVFKYTTSSGGVVTGIVAPATPGSITTPADFEPDGDVDTTDFNTWTANFGSQTATATTGDANGDGIASASDFLVWQRNRTNTGAATSVPEPATWAIILSAIAGLTALRIRSERRPFELAFASRAVAAMAAAGCFAVAAISQAAVTVDRDYRFGDDSGEGAVVGNSAGIIIPPAVVPVTFDSLSPFDDLVVEGGPVYADVSSRPGAGLGAKGISFNGSGQYLRGLRFNFPATASHTTAGTPSGTLDYSGLTNRGFQLWVRPGSTTTTQNVVLDTNQHGVRISNTGFWTLRYNNVDVVSTKAVQLNAWTHIMVVRPYGTATPHGGSILYVNGEAVAARAGNYDLLQDFPLVIGSDTGDGSAGDPIGAVDFFNGTLDDLKIFTFGTTTSGVNKGAFDFGTDNGFAAALTAPTLSHVAGDVDQNGILNGTDITQMIAGWGFKNRNDVNGVLVGDVNTIKKGDLNFDGITDLRDAQKLRVALGSAGVSTAALDAFLAAPEPSSLALAVGLAAAAMGIHRRRQVAKS